MSLRCVCDDKDRLEPPKSKSLRDRSCLIFLRRRPDGVENLCGGAAGIESRSEALSNMIRGATLTSLTIDDAEDRLDDDSRAMRCRNSSNGSWGIGMSRNSSMLGALLSANDARRVEISKLDLDPNNSSILGALKSLYASRSFLLSNTLFGGVSTLGGMIP